MMECYFITFINLWCWERKRLANDTPLEHQNLLVSHCTSIFIFFLILGWHGFLALSNSRKEISTEGPLRSIFGCFSLKLIKFLYVLKLYYLTNNWLADWMVKWLVDWLIDWYNDRLTGCLTDHGLADWQTDWLIDGLSDWYTDCLTNWLTGWLIDWLAYSTTGWLTNQLAAGWLADWQLDTDRMISWLTNGLNERLVSSVTGDWLTG